MTGAMTGLDYNAVYKVAETLEIPMTQSILRKIQAIEAAQLDKNRKEAKERGND